MSYTGLYRPFADVMHHHGADFTVSLYMCENRRVSESETPLIHFLYPAPTALPGQPHFWEGKGLLLGRGEGQKTNCEAVAYVTMPYAYR